MCVYILHISLSNINVYMYLYFLYFAISLDSPLPSKTNPWVKSLYVYVHIPGSKNQILTQIDFSGTRSNRIKATTPTETHFLCFCSNKTKRGKRHHLCSPSATDGTFNW